VIVASPEGYGEASVADLGKNPTLQMQPWGRIEGTYLSGGQPVAGRELMLGFDGDERRGVGFDFMAFKVTTDSEGKFNFPRVPWGRLQLIRLVVTEEGVHKSWIHAPLQTVKVRPGETATVTVGNSGYSIAARLRWPTGVKLDATMRFQGSLRTAFPKPPEAVMKNPEAFEQWAQLPEIRALQKSMRSYVCSINAEGVVTAEDVSPGKYQLGVGYFSTPSDPNSTPVGFEGATEVNIPADPPTGTVDLGEIQMRRWEQPGQ